MGKHELDLLSYADDAVLIAVSEDNLPNLTKTKCMTIARESLRCKLVIEDTIVDQTMWFDYLGCNITNTGFLEEDIRRRRKKQPQYRDILSMKYGKISQYRMQAKDIRAKMSY